MKKSEVELTCRLDSCKKPYILSEVKRIYGGESSVYQLGFCCAGCYTKYVTKK